MNKSVIVSLILVVVIAGGFLVARNKAGITPTPEPVACTMEAKLCPDGSYVGRSGPSCEFAECPIASGINKSGASGVVTLSPTCPVERIPPDPNCAPKFYSTTINVMKKGSSLIIKTTKSDTNGKFSVELTPGSYILQAQGGTVMPRCPETSVIVESGKYTNTEISCDTGIR